ncbi:DUF2793 domain-containing protein [Sphingomonas flavalba]|uniref:DUF2793 domain-containing protein n=1 Tax=Sphingomonas flavalba TaxID=2559804 RepID=UPI0039E0348F
MTEMTSARLGLPYLAAGQAQKEVAHNEALALIDAACMAAAESMDLAVPPGDAAPGQCWIVAAGGSGAWAGRDGALACMTDGGWRFLPPVMGMRLWIGDRGLWANWAGGWTVGIAPVAEIHVDGTRVIAARQAAVAVPSGGATIDGEARAAIAALIGRLQAHGLIG